MQNVNVCQLLWAESSEITEIDNEIQELSERASRLRNQPIVNMEEYLNDISYKFACFDVTFNWTIAAPTVGQLEEMFNAGY